MPTVPIWELTWPLVERYVHAWHTGLAVKVSSAKSLELYRILSSKIDHLQLHTKTTQPARGEIIGCMILRLRYPMFDQCRLTIAFWKLLHECVYINESMTFQHVSRPRVMMYRFCICLLNNISVGRWSHWDVYSGLASVTWINHSIVQLNVQFSLEHQCWDNQLTARTTASSTKAQCLPQVILPLFRGEELHY